MLLKVLKLVKVSFLSLTAPGGAYLDSRLGSLPHLLKPVLRTRSVCLPCAPRGGCCKGGKGAAGLRGDRDGGATRRGPPETAQTPRPTKAEISDHTQTPSSASILRRDVQRGHRTTGAPGWPLEKTQQEPLSGGPSRTAVALELSSGSQLRLINYHVSLVCPRHAPFLTRDEDPAARPRLRRTSHCRTSAPGGVSNDSAFIAVKRVTFSI